MLENAPAWHKVHTAALAPANHSSPATWISVIGHFTSLDIIEMCSSSKGNIPEIFRVLILQLTIQIAFTNSHTISLYWTWELGYKCEQRKILTYTTWIGSFLTISAGWRICRSWFQSESQSDFLKLQDNQSEDSEQFGCQSANRTTEELLEYNIWYFLSWSAISLHQCSTISIYQPDLLEYVPARHMLQIRDVVEPERTRSLPHTTKQTRMLLFYLANLKYSPTPNRI